MNKNKNIKHQITEELYNSIEKKIIFLKNSIKAAKESRDNETKSSVGDKYETGRAMMQMELEKNMEQLVKAENLKNGLAKIDFHIETQKVEFGSFIETDHGNYFISIAFGKVKINETSVFCISPISPLGKILTGKITGEKINFQGKEIEIKSFF